MSSKVTEYIVIAKVMLLNSGNFIMVQGNVHSLNETLCFLFKKLCPLKTLSPKTNNFTNEIHMRREIHKA